MPYKDKAHKRAYDSNHLEKNRAKALARKYGMTPDDYQKLLIEQAGVCAACHQPEVAIQGGRLQALAVDHCHRSGKIRALLCLKCNTTLGLLDDSIERLYALIAYVKHHS